MKKFTLLFVGIGLAMSSLKAQTAIEILQKANKKCLEINNGKYSLERSFKFLSEKDTIKQEGYAVFEKTPADTIFGKKFWIENTKDSFARYYNGKLLHSLYFKHKGVLIDTIKAEYQNMLNGNIIGKYIHFPFTSKEPFSQLKDSTLTFTFDNAVKDTLHHIIKISYPNSEDNKIKNQYYRWYINKYTYLPEIKEVYLEYDSEVQYEHFKITAHDFDKPQYSTFLSGKHWDSTYEIRYPKPYEPPKPLPNNTSIVNWQAESFTGDSLQFSKLQGKLFLIDFWYRSCAPCIKAMPFLDSMHHKYGKQGLTVIGLNPYDYKRKGKEKFNTFLKRHKVDYTLAFIKPAIAKDFKVRLYPTLYFVDASGKVLYSQLGYSEETDATLDKFISEYLAKH